MYLSKNYCWMLCISRRVDGYPAEIWPPCITPESTLCCCCYCSGVSSRGEHDSRAPWAEGPAISCLPWKRWPGCLQEPALGKDLGQPSMAGWHRAQSTGALLFVCLQENVDFPRRRLPTETPCVCAMEVWRGALHDVERPTSAHWSRLGWDPLSSRITLSQPRGRVCRAARMPCWDRGSML